MARRRDDERGTSEVVGVVLMLGLVLLGMTATLVVASAAITDMEGTVNVGQAQNAMRALDSEVSDVGFGMQSTGHVDVGGTAGTYTVRENAGHITIRHVGYEDSHDVVLYQSDMGAVTYEHSGTTIGYQMGGLWKQTGDSDESAMVSRPNIQFRNQTLTMPLVRLTGDGSMSGGSLDVETPVGARSRVYPSSTATYPDGTAYTNPVHGDGTIEIEVQSEFYRAWGEFFRTELNQTVTYDHDTRTVSVSMNASEETTANTPDTGSRVAGGVFGAITTTQVSEETRIQSDSVVDSYDSALGGYPGQSGSNGNVTIGSSVKVNDDTSIKGNLNTSGSVELGSSTQVTGDLEYGTSCNGCDPSKVGGSVSSTGQAPTTTAADDYIDDRIADIAADNDNPTAGSTLDDIENSNCGPGSTCTLTAGDYHFGGIALNGDDQQLVLDTTDGNINLALDASIGSGNLYLNGGKIKVIGPGRVNFYVSSTSDRIELNSDGQITVDTDDDGTRDYSASQVWIYAKSDTDVVINSESGTTAVLYVPRGSSGESAIELNSRSHIYGALVGYVDVINSRSGVHYDEALARTWAIPENAPPDTGDGSENTTTVTYLLVSENEVVIEAD
ncbi:DUF7289 family protein [Haloarcula marina]|uniref:DUF7289 family protein n=1 Tax=Haloarcula marina TaxID=2961574 RepID=UPI0020B81556|nr:hypothetical protein [Halomicroarcula marina]